MGEPVVDSKMTGMEKRSGIDREVRRPSTCFPQCIPHKSHTQLRPMEKSEDLYEYLHEIVSGVYERSVRVNGDRSLTHLERSGELAAEVVLKPFDYYEKCLGLGHDSVEDTNDGTPGFPFKMQFEDPGFSHAAASNGKRPRFYNPKHDIYYWDGLLHEAGPAGKGLIKSWELLYRAPDRGKYLNYMQKILNIDFSDNPNLEHQVFTALFKALGDRRHNAYTESNLPPEIIHSRLEDALDSYRSNLELPIGPVRALRNIHDDLQIYFPTIEQSLINLEEETREMHETIGDQIYSIAILRAAIDDFRTYQEYKRKVIETALGPEEWAKALDAATINGGGLRGNSHEFPRLKVELLLKEMRYMYLRPGIEHYTNPPRPNHA